MNEKINRLSRGLIDDAPSKVIIAPMRIESTASQGTVIQADFAIRAEDRSFLRGLIYSTSRQVRPSSPYFSGSNSRISYSIDTEALNIGDVIEGSFGLVTCAGEFTLPYSITIDRPVQKQKYDSAPAEGSVIDAGDILRELAAEKAAGPGGRVSKSSPAAGSAADPGKDETDKDFYLKLTESPDRNSSMYRSFEHQMRDYVREHILAGAMDDKLIRLYTRVLEPDMVDAATAKALTDMLLTCRVEVPSRFRKLTIRYKELTEEQVVPLTMGRAAFPLYTPDYSLYLTDAEGSSFHIPNLKLIPIMPGNQALLNVCIKAAPDMSVCRIRLAHRLGEVKHLGRDEMLMLYDLARSEGISGEFKTELIESLINNYDWAGNSQDAFVLASLGAEGLKDKTLLTYIRVLAALDLLGDAAGQLKNCDYRRLDPGDLRKICNHILDYMSPEADDDLTELCMYLFDRKQAGDSILEYLCRNYNGMTGDMYRVLTAADEDGLELSDMAERLLGQMLFTGLYDNMDRVFRIYARGTVSLRILKAYYCVKCHRYFLQDEPMDREIVMTIRKTLAGELDNGDMPLVIMLALSKYYSESRIAPEPEDEALAGRVVTELCRRDIILPYFKRYTRGPELPLEVMDRTYVSYRGHNDDSATLILYPENDDAEPIYKEMVNVYGGLFVSSVLLFECEHMSYEIRVTGNGTSEIRQEGDLVADMTAADGRRLCRLNRLIAGSARPDDEEWQKLMDEYAMEDSLGSILFR